MLVRDPCSAVRHPCSAVRDPHAWKFKSSPTSPQQPPPQQTLAPLRLLNGAAGHLSAAASPALPSQHFPALRTHANTHTNTHLTAPQALHLSSMVSVFFLILITVSGLPQE